MKGATVMLAAVTLLAGCAAGDSSSPEGTPSPPARPSFDLSSDQPTQEADPDGDELRGVLGADAVEGGCAYLEAPNGTRYEVIYPPEWRIRAAPLSLTSPSGEVVATGGETITVRGRGTDEIATICQIGPVFVAEEVVSVE